MPRLELSHGRLRGNTLIPPPDGLQAFGPTMEVMIGLHSATEAKRRTTGAALPAAVVGKAMIDTGATVTTIDRPAAERLGLEPSGKVESFGIGGKAVGVTVPCSVDIQGLGVDITRCHCHDLATHIQDLLCLIGRDILRHTVFHYDGPAGTFYLEIRERTAPASLKSIRPGKGARRNRLRRRD
ncbi:MAG: hypothetical protein C4547_13315 [Phycisphaerales bacterium]|nr:MAG: hypothetical protein C4547_13315 [Phycisphaerales bacterium]